MNENRQFLNAALQSATPEQIALISETASFICGNMTTENARRFIMAFGLAEQAVKLNESQIASYERIMKITAAQN